MVMQLRREILGRKKIWAFHVCILQHVEAFDPKHKLPHHQMTGALFFLINNLILRRSGKLYINKVFLTPLLPK